MTTEEAKTMALSPIGHAPHELATALRVLADALRTAGGQAVEMREAAAKVAEHYGDVTRGCETIRPGEAAQTIADAIRALPAPAARTDALCDRCRAEGCPHHTTPASAPTPGPPEPIVGAHGPKPRPDDPAMCLHCERPVVVRDGWVRHGITSALGPLPDAPTPVTPPAPVFDAEAALVAVDEETDNVALWPKDRAVTVRDLKQLVYTALDAGRKP